MHYFMEARAGSDCPAAVEHLLQRCMQQAFHVLSLPIDPLLRQYIFLAATQSFQKSLIKQYTLNHI